MNFHEAERQYQRLMARREAGNITAADFDQAVQNLVIVDPAGARWRIGGLTGRWYRTQGDRWVVVSPAGQAANGDASKLAAPSTLRRKWRLRAPKRQMLRAVLPLFISLGCILMIYMVVVLAALFDRGVKLAVVFPFLNPAPLAATPSETPVPVASLMPTFTLTPSPTSTVTPTPTLPPPLMLRASQGPWLLIANAEGLWASAADGKALTRLSRQKVAAPVDLERAAAPGGGLIAFVAAPDPSKPNTLALNILRLPEVKPLAVIPLTAPDFGFQGDLPSAAALSAVVNRNSLAWSPDSQHLAFVGMQDRQSADLYLYSVASGEVKRIDSQSSQAFDPVWSPDSRFVVFFSAERLENGSGAGDLEAAWVASPGAAAATRLYQPASSREVIAGWVSPSRFAVFGWTTSCQGNSLRFVDVETHQVKLVYDGCFNAAAVEPGSGNILFTVEDELAASCTCGKSVGKRGIYYLPAGLGLPRLVRQQPAGDIRWHADAGLFLAGENGNWRTAFSAGGSATELAAADMDNLPAVARSSGYWAWVGSPGSANEGLWVSLPGQPPLKAAGAEAYLALWAPDGKTLIYFSNQRMMLAQPPQYFAVALEVFGAEVEQAVWVWR